MTPNDSRPDDPLRSLVGPLIGGVTVLASVVVPVLGWAFFPLGLARLW